MTSANTRQNPAPETSPGQRPKPAPPNGAPVRATGAQALVRSLEAVGCEVVFGIPGGTILPTYDPLLDSTKVRHVLVRHEQAAGHAAVGYAQVTGRTGVCMATSGPGATNLVTALADASMDSVPMVAITGQQSTGLIGTDAFQEADICGITLPVTKHNFLVTDPAEIPRTIAEAFYIASSGRPGPVLVDIPKDVQQLNMSFSWPPEQRLPGYRPVGKPHGKQVREAARLMGEAKRPVLYVGGGVLKAEASEELTRLAEHTGIPVVTTLMARGAFPDSHPLHLGMPGMHGTVPAVAAMQRSDLLIALGTRFDDRVTGKLSGFAPEAKVVHADIDPAEISKNRVADVPIVGDCKEVLTELLEAVDDSPADRQRGGLSEWWEQLEDWRRRFPLGYDWPADDTLSPEYVIERIGKLAGPEAVYSAGVGQHQMWAAQFIEYQRPGSWLNSGGLGTMGYAVPAAMGAKAGAPDRQVWAIDGDGCFQMTNQELATCAIEGLPIKVAVINNGNLGMVRQWQNLFYAERYSQSDLGTHGHRIPDFALLAEALGGVGMRCESAADVDSVIERAMEIDDRPVVIDFVVGKDAQVWPMVAAGTGNDEIMAARGIRPLFDDDEG
ncbi:MULTISPECIES: acetolactate synthase large subunit [unclassified Actinopolyspora]|uniref:acetolactate synthase large subunit n=1 Tax=unclassified Actinopolyspora TaxID=2639451 RepID=UPI0013F5B652|nr:MULTISPECIES: acetolactate synthase large subunit [unclassified Actinopolyspora]NHD17315.1 acetolactate synthase large subunit [Actinopolyspora sp. BKK2]NHE76467.1 acetolactate synthase large subunit [Actinopolyspora sp. BKK1]